MPHIITSHMAKSRKSARGEARGAIIQAALPDMPPFMSIAIGMIQAQASKTAMARDPPTSQRSRRSAVSSALRRITCRRPSADDAVRAPVYLREVRVRVVEPQIDVALRLRLAGREFGFRELETGRQGHVHTMRVAGDGIGDRAGGRVDEPRHSDQGGALLHIDLEIDAFVER